PGGFFEAGKNRAGIFDFFRRRFCYHRILRPRQRVGRLRRGRGRRGRHRPGLSGGARRAGRRGGPRPGAGSKPGAAARPRPGGGVWVVWGAGGWLGGIWRLWGVLPGILTRWRRRWKWSAGHIGWGAGRRITERTAELGRNRPSRERSADHNQECGDSSHDRLLGQLFAFVQWPCFAHVPVNIANSPKTSAPTLATPPLDPP